LSQDHVAYVAGAGPQRHVELLGGEHPHDQQRPLDPGVAQRARLGGAGHADPARPAGQRRPGGGDGPVAVPVGLDHRHHLGGGGGAQQPYVVPDRVQVDADLRLLHAANATGGLRRRP